MAQIEQLELEARDVRRKIERAHNDEDRRILNRQLKELQDDIARLQSRLP
jgi:cell division septum initiation protein DivIVA